MSNTRFSEWNLFVQLCMQWIKLFVQVVNQAVVSCKPLHLLKLLKIRFSSLREITNCRRPRCSWLRLFSSIFQLIFYPKQIMKMLNGLIWNLKQQRRRSTHNVPTFQRSQDDVNCKTFKNRKLGITLSSLNTYKKL